MKIACLGGGPAGLYFAISMKLRDARARHHRVRAQPARRHLRLGRGVFRRDLRQHRRQRSAQRRDDPRAISPIGTTSRSIIAASESSRAATASPASRARSCSCCCRSARASSASSCVFQTEIASAAALAKNYDLVVAADGLNSRTRKRIRRHTSSPPSICARTSSSGSAPSRNSTTPSPSSSRRPSTAGSGRTPISSTPTPRPSSSNARRRPGRSSASAP